ncbi:hypothetical protein B0H16DRAFT_1470188 [Mycena metata]|uniref:Uncharacterized protein n=1 Tax=Mycena metata TaxID=1033252 RepID=A0AAD7HWZ6_9AGAR|nr:hypothetical protein B0H16DRAFT_1470188 [Mycena metata]
MLPAKSMDVPAGGLAQFLQQNLRFKVFLYYAVHIRQNEFRRNFSRHNTPTQASWMFYLLGVLLYLVGFNGDDVPDIHGVNVFGLAVSQAEFFLKECAETVALFRVSKQAIFLDYKEYDPHRTVKVIFVSRQPPCNFKRILVNDNPVLDFSTKEKICSPAWTDVQRVVEATLLALSRVDGALLVETDSDGRVVGMQKESIDGLLTDMAGVEAVFAEALALLCVQMKKPVAESFQSGLNGDAKGAVRSPGISRINRRACMLPKSISRLYALSGFVYLAAMSNIYRLPRITLDSNFYGVEDAYKLVNEYALDTALHFEPGSATRDELDDVMERYIRPSVHLLDCALQPANTGWLHRHELTMLELILVHDALSNIMGFLHVVWQFRLLDDGGQLPTDISIGDQSSAPQAYVAFRGGCLRGLELLNELVAVYVPESANRVTPSTIQLNLSRALMIGRAWSEVEDQTDFPSFLITNTEQIFLGLGG